MKSLQLAVVSCILLAALCAQPLTAATIEGYVLDPNWYAPHPWLASPRVYGTGMYEFGAAGSINYSSSFGFATGTGIYGNFSVSSPAGTYTMASWDNWWRPAFAFNQVLTTYLRTILRLHANMWSYANTWGGAYNEIGQTFAASGTSVTMVVLRSPWEGTNFTVTFHQGGPDGPQVGPSRSFTSHSGPTHARLVWNGGEVATVPGQIYYLRVKAAGTTKGMLCYHDPVPDLSDPMPEGCLYHDGVAVPGTDLGVTICSDDDGIVTNLFVRKEANSPMVTSVGQTFVARGVNLLSFTAWLPDSSATYIATLRNGFGGPIIGTPKQAKVMRGADPEVTWLWAPGECPLTPGNTYYIEVTKLGGGTFMAHLNGYGQYGGGQAYVNGVAQGGSIDMAGCIMEEESAGSATMATVGFATFPYVLPAERGSDRVTLRWTTDVPSDSTVEYSAWTCPYTNTYYDSTLVTTHTALITGLQPNTMYHFRVRSAASGRRPGVTRDFVVCTTEDTANLLANPGFESGSGSSPRPITGWTTTGLDLRASDGTWFGEVPPYSGSWLCEGATNGTSPDAYLYQTVPATPGADYSFTAAIGSWMMENGTWKYDVWDKTDRLDYLRIGIDPYGNNSPGATSIIWSPQFYSHLRYSTVGIRATAQAANVTVLISLRGVGGYGDYWHIYGVDDCRLSEVTTFTPFSLHDLKANQPDGVFAQVSDLIVTATSAEAGAYYAETADRTQGIRIEPTNSAAVGQKVTVKGKLATDPITHERSLKYATFVSAVGDTEPEPLLMECNTLGGGALGVIPAVPGSNGPHNVGLAVRVAGKVTVKDTVASRYVFLNDGSVPGFGVKVDTSHIGPALVPNVGDQVGISGICSVYMAGTVKPLVIVRRAADIRKFN